jgi:clan AA aspartic protease
MSPGPYPSLRVRFEIQGLTFDVEALVDTGFYGHLVVPETLVGRLPQPHTFDRARTASGEVVVVGIDEGTVEVVDQPRPIEASIIALGTEFLIGIQTLNHFRVTFDHGQRVIVEP